MPEENQEFKIDDVLNKRFGNETILKWKQDHKKRKLNIIVVEDKIAVLRPITATEVSTYSLMLTDPETGMEKATRYLLEELWLDGDREIIDDEEYFISAMLQTQKIIELKKSDFYQL